MEDIRMKVRDIVEIAVLPIMTFGILVLADINKNINSLNIQVGVVIANQSSSERRIELLEKKIEKIEDKTK